jgi:hypothetical protein
METNNQLHRTIKDSELKIQQLEAGKIRVELNHLSVVYFN